MTPTSVWWMSRWLSTGTIEDTFFAAAAEAMRRILVERARKQDARKRHGLGFRTDLQDPESPADSPSVDLLTLDAALSELEEHDPQAAKLVKLRFFAGLTHQEAASAMGVTRRVADRLWRVARAWLFQRVNRS